MMRRLLAAAVLAILLATGTTLWSEDSRGPVMYGPGTATCVTWTSDRKAEPDADQAAREGWVPGWVSAASHYTSGSLAQRDVKGLLGFVDRHCAQHPLDRVSDACRTLAGELAQRGKTISIKTP
jgi:hypothetical protein